MADASRLDQLPEVYAEALRLCDQGCDEAGIAQRLGVEREAVSALVSLARAKLAALRTSC